MRPIVAALVVFAGLAATTPGEAQELRPESVSRFGGRYALDCTAPASAQVRIDAQTLVVQQGARVVRTPNRQDSFASFGAAPTSPVPEGYQVEFIGDTFSLYVFEDDAGYYVSLGGYTEAAGKVVDARALKARLRRCAP